MLGIYGIDHTYSIDTKKQSVLGIALRVLWQNSISRFSATPERKNYNIKCFISSSGNQTHKLSRLHACVSVSQLASKMKLLFKISHFL